VVFIDDLDRCLPENAINVMEALKLYLDRANCIFAIGAESGIIEEGIRQRYHGNVRLSAEDYLDKIVQLPFVLPQADADSALSLLGVHGDLPVHKSEAMRTLIFAGTGGNPRRVKRYVNALYNKKIKETLDAKVEKVSEGFRMEDSPCVLVTSEYGWTANMERIMKAQALRDNSMTSYMVSKKTMEINPKHGIVKELKNLLDKDSSNSTIKDIIWLLYDTSLLASGFSVEDPNTFAKRMHKMLLFGLQDDTSIPETTSSSSTNLNTNTTTEVKNSFLDQCD